MACCEYDCLTCGKHSYGLPPCQCGEKERVVISFDEMGMHDDDDD